LEKSKAGEPLPITNDGEQRRDFVHVSDVVRANIASMDSSKYHRIINIGSGKNISVNEIAKIIGGKTTTAGFRLEPKISLTDISAAKSYLDWEPMVNFESWLSIS
jgi:UDP-glucose 4-epimerase